MEIANPIYDAVFKFLMEDKKAAALIIGAITGFEIEDIELRPTEVALDAKGERQWTVYRLDLLAHVKTPEGAKAVLIEVQKAKFHTDIERFRRYLGTQYASAENYEQGSVGSGGVCHRRAMPLFTIYILGHRLEHNGDVPVIRVNRVYTDNATGTNLTERDKFIESLTHDCAIIQVPALAGRRRDRLERMLAVFDQALIKPDNRHLLDVADTECPDESQVLIRRLARAVADKEVRQRMLVEDEIVTEFEERDRREDELKALAEEERRQKEAAEAREGEERRQKEDERRQKEAAETREAEERRQKEAALAELEQLKRQLGKG
jgi:hypothetical protein